ncbi:hypothetical protein [Hanstruepera flava]|uniref:hypothetical protein n=1 Tax=Hanstruepera flava TaxID=2930218 RepID=UPI0020292BE9|nr:hypothetical protein [Hanstruepera flava]
MKRFLSFVFGFCLLVSCSNDDDNNNNNQNNQFIPNIVFDTGTLINTNLPQYSDLQFPNNYVTLNSNYGLNGVVVFYAGGNNYSAFELTDPNHEVRSCSTLEVEGVIATCNCSEAKSYDILTGQPQQGTTGNYGLKRYFVEVNGNIIRVYNN